MSPQTLPLLESTGRHVVHFYDDEDAFLAHAAGFFREGFATGEGAVCVGTRAHNAALRHDLGPAAAAIAFLDAETTLDALLRDGQPDAALFDHVVGRALDRADPAGRGLHVMGEMVALLCQRGIPEQAVGLERMWNQLMQRRPFRLLCAYPVHAFGDAATHGCLDAVLDAHGTVVPAEAEPTRPTPGHDAARMLARLQAEVARREALQRSFAQQEQEMADFLENSVEGMHRVGADGRIQWANRAQLAMLGYERHEYVGQRMRDFHVDPTVLDGVMERLQRGEPVYDQRIRLRCKDGSVKDLLVHSNAHLEDGRFVHSRCFMRDVTQQTALERQRSEVAARLARRERQQAAVAELGQVALRSRDVDELLATVVRRVCEELDNDCAAVLRVGDGGGRILAAHGYPPQAIGTYLVPIGPGTMAGYVVAADRPVIMEDLHRERRFEVSPLLRSLGMTSGIGCSIATGPGELWGILGSHGRKAAQFTEDDAAFLVAVANIVGSAVARQRTEGELRRHRDHLEVVADVGQAALRSRDLGEVLTHATRRVAEVLGADVCGIVRRDGDEAVLVGGHGFPPAVVGSARMPLGAGTLAGYCFRNPGPVTSLDVRNDSRFAVSPLMRDAGVGPCAATLIETPEGGPWGILGAFRRSGTPFQPDDARLLASISGLLGVIVARLRAETDLRHHRDHLEDLVAERTRRLEDSNRELEAFNYTVSHDLRAPLRAIGSFSEILHTRYGDRLDTEGQRLLDQVRRATVRMGELIDDLLDLARLGLVPLERTPLDLSALAGDVARALREAEPGRTVEFACAPGLAANADAQLVRAVLENLLGNAWKFTRKTLTAKVEVGKLGDAFFVRDNGAGFDVALAERLFQPFQRLHRASDFEGNGIGLATVARIVARHGGRVWADGKPGAGATFWFTLP